VPEPPAEENPGPSTEDIMNSVLQEVAQQKSVQEQIVHTPRPKPIPDVPKNPEIKVQFVANPDINKTFPPQSPAPQTNQPVTGGFAQPTRTVPQAQGPLNGEPLKAKPPEERS